MKKFSRYKSSYWLTGAAAGLVAVSGGERLMAMPGIKVSELSLRRAAALQRFGAGYENVLGTSLDLIVEAPRLGEARACEVAILCEIERLRQILSTYDQTSEISRVMAGAPVTSPELAQLLSAYEAWRARTGGLIDVNLGGVAAAWREYGRTGRLPDEVALAAARSGPFALNVDALGKAFIIDRAVEVARHIAPGGIINLGGDLRAWGDTSWLVGIADPLDPSENAPPVATFRLRDAAVATSGGYARFFEVGGKRFSHLIDPRTLRPRDVGGSATVLAADSVTANALSTAASIAGMEAGAALAEANGAKGYFLADAAGGTMSGGFLAAAAAVPAGSTPAGAANHSAAAGAGTAEKSGEAAAAAKWPDGYQVAVEVALKKHPKGPKTIYRPYVAVWIQNAKGQLVRTISLWGEDSRWQRKLSTWWQVPHEGGDEPQVTARATRVAGVYTVTWDGKDDFGRKLPAGDYSVCLEVCREDGHHVVDTVALTCGAAPVTGTFRETAESDASTVSYGPKKS